MAEGTVQLLYDASGPQGATPVLLIHGFPLSRAIWAGTLTTLGAEWRVIAPDLRGHGASPSPEDATSMDGMARDLLALLDRLGHRAVHVVGHSMGGYVAFALHRLAPERVRTLTLVATRATPDSPEAKQARRKQADMVQMDGLRALADLLVPKLVGSAATPILMEEVRRVVEGMPVTGAVRALEAMADRPDATPLLREIKAPTLVIAGADDKVMPPQETDRLAREIPNATKEVLPKVGHLPMLEDSPKFAGALAAFLRANP